MREHDSWLLSHNDIAEIIRHIVLLSREHTLKGFMLNLITYRVNIDVVDDQVTIHWLAVGLLSTTTHKVARIGTNYLEKHIVIEQQQLMKAFQLHFEISTFIYPEAVKVCLIT